MYRGKRYCVAGGKGGGGGSYDPQVGAAAQMNANTAAKAENYAETYQNTYVAPLLKQMTQASAQNQTNLNNLYQLNEQSMQNQLNEYNQYGLPAARDYYNMVSGYSAPAYAEQQAESALGDMRSAEASQQGNFSRTMSSYGIDPSSGAAVVGQAVMATNNAANEAAAMTRARTAARNLGIQLTADAANFGRGGASVATQFGNSAANNTNAAASNSYGAINAAVAGAQPGMAGYNTALNAGIANLNAYTSLDNTSMQLQGQNASGFGSFFGALGAAALGNPHIFSDRRLKKAVVEISRLPSGLKVYEFEYVWGGGRRVGVMADEVERLFPAAVSRDVFGFKSVDYSQVR